MTVPVTHDVAHSAAESLAMKSTAAATYASSAGALYFGLTADEFAALASIVIALITMVANIAVTAYFKHQHLKLARQRASMGAPGVLFDRVDACTESDQPQTD